MDMQRQSRAFVEREVIPYARQFDEEEQIPRELISKMAEAGYLGLNISEVYGGSDLDWVQYGLVTEEFGRGCSSVRSLLTVHGMVAHTIARWGNQASKERWLPELAAGRAIGALGLSEPNAGSDARGIETTARQVGDEFVVNGTKRWITFGQIADVFLILTQCEGKPTAFLLEGSTPGLTVEPIHGMTGTAGSMLAQLTMEECVIPKSHVVGAVGFGFSHVINTALDFGRYSVAWGCVGIGQACLEASLRHTNDRQQFGVPLREHQLVQQMITDMATDVQAARLLCLDAGAAKDSKDPNHLMKTFMAKYQASKMANRAAGDAVQLHGAIGCHRDSPVQRYMRDAKVMEIIEGSTQIQQVTIAQFAYRELLR